MPLSVYSLSCCFAASLNSFYRQLEKAWIHVLHMCVCVCVYWKCARLHLHTLFLIKKLEGSRVCLQHLEEWKPVAGRGAVTVSLCVCVCVYTWFCACVCATPVCVCTRSCLCTHLSSLLHVSKSCTMCLLLSFSLSNDATTKNQHTHTHTGAFLGIHHHACAPVCVFSVGQKVSLKGRDLSTHSCKSTSFQLKLFNKHPLFWCHSLKIKWLVFSNPFVYSRGASSLWSE